MDSFNVIIVILLSFILWTIYNKDQEEPTVIYYTDPWPRYYWRRGLHRNRRRGGRHRRP